MKNIKEEILEKHCYTELVYQRINKKLSVNFTKKEIEILIRKAIEEADLSKIEKRGKNFYITNNKQHIRITVNSYTFRIITVDKAEKRF